MTKVENTNKSLFKIFVVNICLKIIQNLKFIHFGDWLSFWCAIFHKTDPTPVKKIDLLKNKLSESI